MGSRDGPEQRLDGGRRNRSRSDRGSHNPRGGHQVLRGVRSTETRLGGHAEVSASARGPVAFLDRKERGFNHLRQISVDSLRQFRQSWSDSPLYPTKNLERIRAFFRFCHQAGWIKQNPALAVKPPKVSQSPTLPFSREDMTRIVAACEKYGGNRDRIKAFVLTMRYTGLRIGDTIRLSKTQVSDGKVFVRTAKTGQPVTVPVPPDVVTALAKVENRSDRYFWTGKNIRSAVANWSRYLSTVFEIAKIPDAHSHRFRDTCAVELLLAGASVEDVATILGNTQVVAKPEGFGFRMPPPLITRAMTSCRNPGRRAIVSAKRRQ